jgi:hypothetical protein
MTMKTFCGISGYQTLPNEYKTSSYSSYKEASPTPKSLLSMLPPRPRVSRSFSFSESQISSKPERQTKQKKFQDSDENKQFSKTQSMYGLQGRSLNLTPNMSPTQCSKCHQTPDADLTTHTQIQAGQFQPLSRSLSLVSLQPSQLTIHNNLKTAHKGPPGQSSSGKRTRAPSIGHIYQNIKTEHAGIWSRGRRAESCRNLRDLSEHDGTCKLRIC